MCGITGFIDKRAVGRQRRLEIASQMAASLLHRGPDDAGVWAEESISVAFGFRRLAILDLSPAGHQPMHSPCRRYTIVFNGEVYNLSLIHISSASCTTHPIAAGRSNACPDCWFQAAKSPCGFTRLI